MRSLIYSVTVFLFVQVALSANPLGNCGGGRAVPYTFAAGSNGACNIPTIGIPTANVDGVFFAGGAKCGACYEVTGPLGTVAVQIVDQCGVGTVSGECSGEVTQFGIDEVNAFNLIVNRTTAKQVTDLGIRAVTCTVDGNVKYVSKTEPSNNYFSLQIWNFRVPLAQVRVKGSGWSGYNTLTRQGTSGIWEWNKKDNNLRFPITLYLVGTTDELVTSTISSFTDGVTDFGDQFTAVIADNGNKCPMTASPAVVFDDKVGAGWDFSNTFNGTATPNTSNVRVGTTSILASLAPFGGVLFTRTGGFNPKYFSYLSFMATSASGDVSLRVYLGDGTGLTTTQTVTGSWQTFNISVASLTTHDAETDLVFMNTNNHYADLYFDEIRWGLSATTPLDDVTQVTTTGFQFVDTTTSTPGGGGVVIVDTSSGTTGGFSFSDDSDSSSSIVGVSMAILVCLAALL